LVSVINYKKGVKMKNLVPLLVLSLFFASNTLLSQDLQSYIVEFDTLINVDSYMNSNKNIDKEKIKNDKTDKLKFIKNLIDETSLVNMRKLLTNLSSDVKYLKTRKGIDFDASNLSSGVYFYTIKTNDFIDRKKMILLR